MSLIHNFFLEVEAGLHALFCVYKLMIIFLETSQQEFIIYTNAYSSFIIKNCEVKCGFKCIQFFYNKKLFDKCCLPCVQKCHQMSIDVVYDCITSCGLTKSIDDNIGIYPLAKLFYVLFYN